MSNFAIINAKQLKAMYAIANNADRRDESLRIVRVESHDSANRLQTYVATDRVRICVACASCWLKADGLSQLPDDVQEFDAVYFNKEQIKTVSSIIGNASGIVIVREGETYVARSDCKLDFIHVPSYKYGQYPNYQKLFTDYDYSKQEIASIYCNSRLLMEIIKVIDAFSETDNPAIRVYNDGINKPIEIMHKDRMCYIRCALMPINYNKSDYKNW